MEETILRKFRLRVDKIFNQEPKIIGKDVLPKYLEAKPPRLAQAKLIFKMYLCLLP